MVCLSITRPGARIYRTKGSQRQLIAGVNDTGLVGCFKSECKHVSFLFEVDENYNGPKNLLYKYSGYIDISKNIVRCIHTPNYEQLQQQHLHSQHFSLTRFCISYTHERKARGSGVMPIRSLFCRNVITYTLLPARGRG